MGFVLHAQFLGPRTKPNNRIGAKQCFNFVKLIHKLSGFYEGVQAGISLAMWLRLTLHRSRKIFFLLFLQIVAFIYFMCVCVYLSVRMHAVCMKAWIDGTVIVPRCQ